MHSMHFFSSTCMYICSYISEGFSENDDKIKALTLIKAMHACAVRCEIMIAFNRADSQQLQ